MKKIGPLFLMGLLIIGVGCSSSDTNEGVMNPPNNDNNSGDTGNNPPTAAVSYQDDIRIIIQNNCISCHSDPPRQSAPMPLTTLIEVRSAVMNRGLLTRINSTSNPMPPVGRMPAATRQLIQDWVDLGFPE